MYGFLFPDDEEQFTLPRNIVYYDDDLVIWPIPAAHYSPQLNPTPAAVINVSKKARYWVARAAMMDAFIDPEYQPGLITGWDNDSEQQKSQYPSFSTDSTAEVDYTNYVIVPPAWDTDAEQQLFQLSYQVDKDLLEANVVLFLSPTGWDTDTENQLLQLPYQLDREVADTGIELVEVAYFFDNDAENQLQQLPYQLDRELAEANVEFFIAPIVYDTDAENQKLQDGYSTDRHLADEGVELVQYATGVIIGWDTDAFYQLANPLPFSFDSVSDEGVELPPIASTDTWDDVAEQSFLQPDYYKDHVSDEGVELITIPVHAYDSDTENQLPPVLYQLDREVVDSGVELVETASAYDTDAENQLQQLGYQIDISIADFGVELLPTVTSVMDVNFIGYRGYAIPKALMTLADEGVEKITLNPIITSETWDDFSEQSFLQPGYYKDHLSDEGVENIIIPTIAWEADFSLYTGIQFSSDTVSDECIEKITLSPGTEPWDDMAEQQLLMQTLIIYDFDLADSGVENIILPPFVDIVEIVGDEEE